MRRIAVDAMGGDHGPSVVVEGAVSAAAQYGVDLFLVGQEDLVERELGRQSTAGASVHVVPAADVIEMHASATSALKRKNTSMRVAFDLMKEGKVDAVVSAGHSGAMMVIGMFVLGRLPGVDRPAILTVIPSASGGTVLIDAGANTDCKAAQLVQFAHMGAIYAEKILGVEKPRVGVLSNGEEPEKGTELTRSTSQRLRGSSLNYIGYVEGRDTTSGRADVIVSDGFTGNVALKAAEGVGSLAVQAMKQAFRKTWLCRLGFLFCGKAIADAFSRLDYANYGGAPLMGLEGVAIIAHGGSSVKAIRNAVRVAHEAVLQDVNGAIVAQLASAAGAKRAVSQV